MMHPYRCQICGETTLLSAPPERCPYCGSAGKRVLPAAEWIDYGAIEMSDQSYRDCQTALELELDNYLYYKCSAGKAENQVTEAIFRRLMKQEEEHAELLAEAMGIPFPEEFCQICADDDFTNMQESNKHEVRAVEFYTQVSSRATEPHIVEIFQALAEVEQEHMIITNMYLTR